MLYDKVVTRKRTIGHGVFVSFHYYEASTYVHAVSSLENQRQGLRRSIDICGYGQADRQRIIITKQKPDRLMSSHKHARTHAQTESSS